MNWHLLLSITTLVGSRYFLIAGAAFVLFYIVLRRPMQSRRIQPKFPVFKDYQREIGYSLLTMIIFAAVPTLLLGNPAIRSHTTLYLHIEQHSHLYFWLAFPLILVMHDSYFYWTHRLMHHPRLFRVFHLVHHRSVNPSPWAAYSFHPLEAFVEAGVYALLLFTIPMHPLHLVGFFLIMIVYNVYGHLGYELYPAGFNRHWALRWINTSVSHNMHHQHFKHNYGLYFTFWDRCMGTLHPDYDQRFAQVTSLKLTHPRENVSLSSGPILHTDVVGEGAQNIEA
ncbi:MAG: sterol desaturase family protein [Cytophagaceae bacterium]|nr:MAG: sterol desaturase family protein [Cytophagaceae bacterium]